VPFGATVVPFTITGSAREARNASPVVLVFVLTDWSIVTLSTVPAGTTMGGGGAGANTLRAVLLDALESGSVASGDVVERLHPHMASSNTTAASHRVITWLRIF
jgi:arginase family enzyme